MLRRGESSKFFGEIRGHCRVIRVKGNRLSTQPDSSLHLDRVPRSVSDCVSLNSLIEIEMIHSSSFVAGSEGTFYATPSFDKNGDLPLGIHRATLSETLKHFGTESRQRQIVATRLGRIHRLALSTGQVSRFVVFGSFITAKAEPNDVDIFLLMEDTFDLSQLTGEAYLVFSNHAVAQARFGVSVFWIRRLAALDGEEKAMEDWQVKRDGGRRGIVEIIGGPA